MPRANLPNWFSITNWLFTATTFVPTSPQVRVLLFAAAAVSVGGWLAWHWWGREG